ncbi:hypothetical protein CHU92_00350, partial [Flavobacterium cyanobacteriorum]
STLFYLTNKFKPLLYKAQYLNLNEHILYRITLEATPKNQKNIDITKVKDIKDPVVNKFTGIKYYVIEFDKKLRICVSSPSEKQIILDYINSDRYDNFTPAFSKFSIANIRIGIKDRKKDPKTIAQSGTPLCGIACIGFLMIKYQPNDYATLIEDLYSYAGAFYNKSNYYIKPWNKWPFGQVYDINPYDKKDYPKSSGKPMAQCDYILLASIKSSENDIRSYDGKSDKNIVIPFDLGEIDVDGIGGLTLSGTITKLLESMLLADEVDDLTSYIDSEEDDLKMLKDMDNLYIKKYECIMLIKSIMLEATQPWTKDDIEQSEKTFPDHWVMYAGDLVDNGKNVTFKVYSWGGEIKVNVTYQQFKNTFHGYIKCKL